MQAFDVVSGDEWFRDCYTWLYRGAWLEWEMEKVDMAVPVSPSELTIKREAIYRHGSQNNGPAYPGDDPREFWQRAEDRNRNTADLYNKIGMAEYEAMEVFVRYKHEKYYVVFYIFFAGAGFYGIPFLFIRRWKLIKWLRMERGVKENGFVFAKCR